MATSKSKHPGPLVIPPAWVIAIVVGILIASIAAWINASVTKSGRLTLPLVAETFLTFLTGVWYWIRYHYTESVTGEQKPFFSLAFTIIIAVAGLSCFATAGRWFWFMTHAAVLLLGTEKDAEIMSYQRRRIGRARNSKNSTKEWQARLLMLHHQYSMVRDLSMCLWWVAYGVSFTVFGLDQRASLGLFGIPFVFLVIAWCSIKVRTFHAESELAR